MNASGYGEISSSARLVVSTIREATKKPTALTTANMMNTAAMPLPVNTTPTIAGAAAEAARSQDVARPVPIARIRVG